MENLLWFVVACFVVALVGILIYYNFSKIPHIREEEKEKWFGKSYKFENLPNDSHWRAERYIQIGVGTIFAEIVEKKSGKRVNLVDKIPGYVEKRKSLFSFSHIKITKNGKFTLSEAE